MAAVGSPQFEIQFFTWPAALVGRYDIFHLHWPEQLVGRQTGRLRWLRQARLRALLARLRRRQIPVVYTLHNHVPHDREFSGLSARAHRDFAALTRVEIHLVPEPDRETGATVVNIPHGSYREPFAHLQRSALLPGRVLFFGIIKRYKGIPALLSIFQTLDEQSVTLRIAGEPVDRDTVDAIDEAARADARVSTHFGFLSDAALVSEVTTAQLVVLPYEEFHSSGAVLVALSLGRPVLVPDSATTRALREEVGAGWVHTFMPPLTVAALRSALTAPIPDTAPDLAERTWSRVQEGHHIAYRLALDELARARREGAAGIHLSLTKLRR